MFLQLFFKFFPCSLYKNIYSQNKKLYKRSVKKGYKEFYNHDDLSTTTEKKDYYQTLKKFSTIALKNYAV